MVTENGDVGASAIRTIAPGDGSWKRSIASALATRIVVAALDDRVGRQAAVADPEVDRPAARMEAQPDRRRRIDLDRQQVAGLRREDVVVVGGRRASGRRELGQPDPRRGVDGLGVDVLPHRVQRGQPFKQRPLLHMTAGRVLVQVVVAVDQPRRGQAPAAVDPALGTPGPRLRRRPRTDRGEPIAIDDEVPVGELAAVVVDRRDRAALDDRDAHRAWAAFTASMILW